MSFAVLVPARLASTRLPNKPLADLGGKPMIVHVLEQARAAGANRVIAATDAPEIASAVSAAGFEVALTGVCASGTERIAQAARDLKLSGVVVNLQGDEPEIDPYLVRAVAQRAAQGDCDCVTAAAPIDAMQAADANTVKVVTTHACMALLFSRAAIPQPANDTVSAPTYLGHMGIYAFAPERLAEVPNLQPCMLEQTERLEQLRWLWHGWKIAVLKTDTFSTSIDTPAELAVAQARLAT